MAKHLFCQVVADGSWKDHGQDLLTACNADPERVCAALNETFKDQGWLFEIREVSDNTSAPSESPKEL